jgi:hypothetical protein
MSNLTQKPAGIKAGIAQGNTLGSVLYFVYASDIPERLDTFVDDTARRYTEVPEQGSA